MPNVNIKYLFWARGGKRRHGGTITDPVPDALLNSGKVTVLFWSVTGATGGPIVSATQTMPSFGAGTTDINATAWCILNGGDHPPHEAYIDAFDIDNGTFLDDDFVKVQDSPSGPENPNRTIEANDYGTIATGSSEYVFADAQLPMGGFQYWKTLTGSASSTKDELDTTAASAGAIAFAFYQSKNGQAIRPADPRLFAVPVVHLPGGAMIIGGVFVSPGDPPPTYDLGSTGDLLSTIAKGTSSVELKAETFTLASKFRIAASKADLKLAKEAQSAGKSKIKG